MKKICEIYDISKEYQRPLGTLYICVSDMDKYELSMILSNIRFNSEMILNYFEWQQYLEISHAYIRNDNKYHMREIRKSKKLETEFSMMYMVDMEIGMEDEFEGIIQEFISQLSRIQQKRFKMYYFQNYTYRQIAEVEKRNVKTIYESVQIAKKKFIKFLEKHPNKNAPTS